jgi:hypothetical protein
MPLRDHFHPPLSERRHWDSFHGAWAEAIALTLNQDQLPSRFFAEARVKLGRSVEIDVGTLEEQGDGPEKSGNGVAIWAPPRPTLRTPLTLAPQDIFEIQVLEDSAGPRLVAAIELVSPSNKDRPAHRHAFAVKCASYLHDEVGLIVVDAVTERKANLHRELLDLLGVAAADQGPSVPDLYAASYRTPPAADALLLEAWLEDLTLGAGLPTVPLWIRPDCCLPLDLELSYGMACAARRII